MTVVTRETNVPKLAGQFKTSKSLGLLATSPPNSFLTPKSCRDACPNPTAEHPPDFAGSCHAGMRSRIHSPIQPALFSANPCLETACNPIRKTRHSGCSKGRSTAWTCQRYRHRHDKKPTHPLTGCQAVILSSEGNCPSKQSRGARSPVNSQLTIF